MTTDNAIVLTNDFATQWGLLSDAVTESRDMLVRVQIYASWIVHNALWDSAYDEYYIVRGARYELDAEIPAAQHRDRRKDKLWRSQEDFIRHMSAELGLTRSTFMARHSQICKELILWCEANDETVVPESVFMKTVEDVVRGYAIGRQVVKGIFEVEEAKRGSRAEITGVKQEAAARLPDIDSDDDEDITVKDAAVAALQYIQEQRAYADGDSRRVAEATRELRTHILREGVTRAYVNDADWMMIDYEPGEGSGGQPMRVKMMFVDDSGELMDFGELEDDIKRWLLMRLNISTHR
jgi:hypothetical protein